MISDASGLITFTTHGRMFSVFIESSSDGFTAKITRYSDILKEKSFNKLLKNIEDAILHICISLDDAAKSGNILDPNFHILSSKFASLYKG